MTHHFFHLHPKKVTHLFSVIINLMEVSKSVELNGYIYIDNSQGQITEILKWCNWQFKNHHSGP